VSYLKRVESVEVNLQSINVGESSGLEAGRDEAGACRYIQHLKTYLPWNDFYKIYFNQHANYIKVEEEEGNK
jgi:hypothetical protein